MKNKIKLVLFGSLGVAVDCLEWLLKLDVIEVIGVVCSQKGRSPWRATTNDRDMLEVAPTLGVPVLHLEDVKKLQADIGLSIRFHAILRKEHLESFKLGVVNLHGAPLPDMRGSMCDCMAIIENRKEYGTSLHWMNEGIDSGDILAVERFPILPHDTVFDLFQLSNTKGLKLIKENLWDIIQGNIKGTSQTKLAQRTGVTPKAYRANDVMKLKRLPSHLKEGDFWNYVRAFQFPGYEPAYTVTNFGRIYHSIHK
jgi:methionyl-tRNA formyltransferase